MIIFIRESRNLRGQVLELFFQHTTIRINTALFRIDTTAPTLRAISFRRLRFAVSEPATVRLTLNGRLITRTVRSGPFSFGAARVRTMRVVAQDAAGNVSRILRYP